MRSKDHYWLEVRLSTDAESVKQIYEASFFSSPQMEASGDSEGLPDRWAVDLRVPLANGRLLMLAAKEMAAVLAHHSVDQIAGAGYGAFLLLGEFLYVALASMEGLSGSHANPTASKGLWKAG
jgi:hypothetical protein